MDDRGFEISDALPSWVTLNIPPFKRGRDQLKQAETDETARKAAVRVHVEGAISQIKTTIYWMDTALCQWHLW